MTYSQGILSNLGDIYFKRGVYDSSGEVFEKASEIVQLCKQHCSHPDFPNLRVHIPNCDHCEYKINILRSTLNVHLERYYVNIPVWRGRGACAYESEYLNSTPIYFDNQPYLYYLQTMRGLSIFYIPTKEEIDDIPDIDIVKCMRGLERVLNPNDIKETQLMVCDRCNKQESALGEFKTCLRCTNVVYYGKACQKASWKLHKKECGKK